MRKSRFSEQQIAFALGQVESGVQATEVCRKVGVSEQTFYAWKRRYGGMRTAEVRRVRQLEDEVRRLKDLVAELSFDKHILQEVLARK